MRYYLDAYTTKPANSLQNALVEQAAEWHGCLVESDAARAACIETMAACVGRCNRDFPKCRPCEISRHDNGFVIQVAGCVDSTFAMFTFRPVRNVYTGGEAVGCV